VISQPKDNPKEADQEKSNTRKEPIKNPPNIAKLKSESPNSHPASFLSKHSYKIKSKESILNKLKELTTSIRKIGKKNSMKFFSTNTEMMHGSDKNMILNF